MPNTAQQSSDEPIAGPSHAPQPQPQPLPSHSSKSEPKPKRPKRRSFNRDIFENKEPLESSSLGLLLNKKNL